MYAPIVAVILGTVGALFPEKIINWTNRAILGPSFENVADLRPRGWYVTAVQFKSVLVVLAGVAWLVIERGHEKVNQTAEADLTPAEK
ncbi:MAG: hypothetical protein U5K70_09745 [Halodesulfurarchaeum sp.]|nr:hypothetical protein [Halodesulfurarchaeum sp.]